MSDIGKINKPIQTIPVRAVNKDPAKKEQNKNKKGKGSQEDEKDSSKLHVNEYI
jgi:hypothetical protein